MAVVDADGLVLGRLCSHVAKRLRNGEEMVVLNAEKAVVSGRKEQLIGMYAHRRIRGASQTKAKGPFYPRRSDMILRRTIRGMVDYKSPSGKAAYKRLRVYLGVPKEFKDAKAETVESAKKPDLTQYVLLGDISERLGSS